MWNSWNLKFHKWNIPKISLSGMMWFLFNMSENIMCLRDFFTRQIHAKSLFSRVISPISHIYNIWKSLPENHIVTSSHTCWIYCVSQCGGRNNIYRRCKYNVKIFKFIISACDLQYEEAFTGNVISLQLYYNDISAFLPTYTQTPPLCHCQ